MKVTELVEMMNNSKVSSLKPEQLKLKLQKELEVKEYLGIKEKKELVEKIINDSIFYEDGIYKIDGIQKYVSLMMRSIEVYTNIELSDDIEKDYDLLCKNKILSVVIDIFYDEYESVLGFLQMKCDYILSSNSVNVQVGQFLNNILSKVDNFSDSLKSAVSSMDLSKLNISQKDLDGVKELIDILK